MLEKSISSSPFVYFDINFIMSLTSAARCHNTSHQPAPAPAEEGEKIFMFPSQTVVLSFYYFVFGVLFISETIRLMSLKCKSVESLLMASDEFQCLC